MEYEAGEAADLMERFGKTLIEEVRDQAIGSWFNQIAQLRQAPEVDTRHDQALRRLVGNWTAEQLDVLKKIVPDVVDTVVHDLIFMLEQSDEFKFCLKLSSGQTIDPTSNEASDGLYGDYLFWTEQYSRYPYNTLDDHMET